MEATCVDDDYRSCKKETSEPIGARRLPRLDRMVISQTTAPTKPQGNAPVSHRATSGTAQYIPPDLEGVDKRNDNKGLLDRTLSIFSHKKKVSTPLIRDVARLIVE